MNSDNVPTRISWFSLLGNKNIESPTIIKNNDDTEINTTFAVRRLCVSLLFLSSTAFRASVRID